MTTAVIITGGKQYRIAEGEIFQCEKIDAEPGSTIEFDKVLLISDGDKVEVGTPYLSGITVGAEVLAQGRDDKIDVIKFKRRKHHMRRQGHRQYLTQLKITRIGAGGGAKKSTAKATAEKPAAAKAAKPTAKKAAPAKSVAPAPAKKAAPKKTTAAKKPAAKTTTKKTTKK